MTFQTLQRHSSTCSRRRRRLPNEATFDQFLLSIRSLPRPLIDSTNFALIYSVLNVPRAMTSLFFFPIGFIYPRSLCCLSTKKTRKTHEIKLNRRK